MAQKIYLIDNSGLLSSDYMKDLAEALQFQFDKHYTPIWGESAQILVAKSESEVVKGAWKVLGQNSIDVAGANGYHWVDPNGVPIAYVLVNGNDNPDITFSHEALEMRRNPYLDKVARAKKINGIDGENVDYLVEVADVTYANVGYDIKVSSGRTIRVSDFYYPEFFYGTGISKNVKYDHMGLVSAPREMIDGGYLSYTDIKGEIYQAVKAKGRVNVQKIADKLNVTEQSVQYGLIALGLVGVSFLSWLIFRKKKQ